MNKIFYRKVWKMEKVILSLKCSVKETNNETKTNNRNKSENKINVESAKRKNKELSKSAIVH